MTDTKGSALPSGSAIQPTDEILVVRNVSGTPTNVTAAAGTAAAKTASDNTQQSVASVSGATIVGHLAVFADVNGTLKDGGAVPSGGTSGGLTAANNLADVASVSAARTNLGLGALALLSTTSLTSNVSGILGIANGGTGAASAGPTAANNVGALAMANNLSDLASASAARTSLGLGSAAILAAGSANGVATLDGTAKVPLSQLPSAIVNGLEFAGLWNASTNTPTLASGAGVQGTMYKVSVTGTTTLDGKSQWNAGDFAFFDGSIWDKVDGLASEVLSVASRTGNIVLTLADIGGAGTAAAQNVAAFAQSANNLSDLASAATARTNLGLGTAAVLPAGVANGAATLDSTGKVPVAQIPSSITGGLKYQGLWNASTNTPSLVSGTGTQGYMYKVSVAGTTALDGNSQWNVGDELFFDGSAWEKLDGLPSEVLSVAGRTGAVVLTLADVAPTGRIITAAGAVTMTNTESIVEIAQTVPAACAVAGAPSPTPYLLQTIKDGAGNASLYPITFTPAAGTIDGAAYGTINTNYGSLTFYFNGTNTRIVA